MRREQAETLAAKKSRTEKEIQDWFVFRDSTCWDSLPGWDYWIGTAYDLDTFYNGLDDSAIVSVYRCGKRIDD